MDKFADLIAQISDYELFCTARKVFGPYTKSDGRKIVIIKEDDGTSRTVSYPKWIVEERLGRPLDSELETIDHLDYDYNNNDDSNLRIVPRKEHSADDTRRVKLIKLKCAWCGVEFERSPRLLRDKAKKNKSGPFHSRECAGKYSRSLQLGKVKKFDVQPAIQSEYYRRKLIEAIELYNFIITGDIDDV